MEVITLKIKGMTCNDCALHIAKLFESTNGIYKKDVSFTNEKGEFEYNPEVVSKQDIIEIINGTKKYKVEKQLTKPTKIDTVMYGISGMTCDQCAETISKKFYNVKGILSEDVSYPKTEGSFSFNPEIISKNEIKEIINSTEHYKVTDEIFANKNNSSHNYDLIIIGGGSAAFSAAIKAESLGIKTLMINGGLDFGGTCVNVGCVPSKNLIRAAETAYRATHSNFAGIKPRGVEIDFTQVIKDKKQLVATLQQKKYMDVVSNFQNLKMIKAWAKFKDKNTIIVDGKDEYRASKFLIATGSTTNIPLIEGLNEVGYLTNVSLFNIEKKPESLTIMGAGYIGLEIAGAYNRLGVKVRIIEFTDRILRTQTEDISEELQKHMIGEGIEILPNFRAVKFEKRGDETIIHCKCPDGSFTEYIEKGKIVVATGTKANTSALGIENIGLKLTNNGSISVNKKMETNISNIFAAGDVADTPAFVYTAAAEGNAAVENAFSGANKELDYSSLPWVVFTDPQISGAGLDEVQAETQNIPFEVSKLDLKHVPRAIAANDMRGFIKLIRNPETDKLIGARIVAPEGGELIQQLSTALKYGITISDLAENFYPYLTLSEGIKLAAVTFRKDVSKLSCCVS